MHGYQSHKKLVGQHLKIFHDKKQLQEDVIPFNKRVMEKGFNTGEVGHIRTDGTPFPTLITTTLLKDTQGKPIAIAGIAKDITELNQTQEALRRAHDELERRVEE